jgi:hypothetical protein
MFGSFSLRWERDARAIFTQNEQVESLVGIKGRHENETLLKMATRERGIVIDANGAPDISKGVRFVRNCHRKIDTFCDTKPVVSLQYASANHVRPHENEHSTHGE